MQSYTRGPNESSKFFFIFHINHWDDVKWFIQCQNRKQNIIFPWVLVIRIWKLVTNHLCCRRRQESLKCKTGFTGSFVPFLLIPPSHPKSPKNEIKAGASCENLTSYWYYVVLEPRNAKLAWQVASFHCHYPSDQNQVWQTECCLKKEIDPDKRLSGSSQRAWNRFLR